MAIGPIHVEWLSRLARKGILGRSYSLLDLGPQDVQVPRSYMTEVARRHLEYKKIQRAVDAVFDGEAPRPDGQDAFYSIFGSTSYASVDLLDKRATYLFDLNNAVPDIGSFDVVTNFGTIEHVFDIGQAFRSLHRLLKPGGVSLHCMPAFAFIDHGFYNIHPIFFIELATANAYDIVDFSYIDNMFVRNSRHGTGVFDFESLPIKLTDTNDTQLFMSKVVDRFRHNIETTPPEAIHGYSAFIFDLLFVALRRTERSPEALRPAIQGAFASGGAMATDA
jgi:SAM-dependent methyltransferase